MRCYVTTCGISVGGEARYSAPGWSLASLRKAGYQPFASPNLPGRASLDQAAFSSTVHGAFFFAKTKKNGGCIPHLETSQISPKIYLQSVAFLLNYTLRIKKKPQF